MNARGSFIVVKASLPWLHAAEQSQTSSSWTPKLILVSPPIYKRFLKGKIAYAMSKIATTSMVLSLPVEIERAYPTSRITPVAIWPGVSVQSQATAALEASLVNKEGGVGKYLRKPEVWSDTIEMIIRDEGKKEIEGRALIDDDYLRERWGFKDEDFIKYRTDPNIEPRRAVPKVYVPFTPFPPLLNQLFLPSLSSLPVLTVEEEDEQLLDTRDLTAMTKVYGSEKKTSAKL